MKLQNLFWPLIILVIISTITIITIDIYRLIKFENKFIEKKQEFIETQANKHINKIKNDLTTIDQTISLLSTPYIFKKLTDKSFDTSYTKTIIKHTLQNIDISIKLLSIDGIELNNINERKDSKNTPIQHNYKTVYKKGILNLYLPIFNSGRQLGIVYIVTPLKEKQIIHDPFSKDSYNNKLTLNNIDHNNTKNFYLHTYTIPILNGVYNIPDKLVFSFDYQVFANLMAQNTNMGIISIILVVTTLCIFLLLIFIIIKKEEKNTKTKILKGIKKQLFQTNKMASIGVMSSSVFHEIAAPLTSIIEITKKIEEHRNDSKQVKHYVTQILKASIRIDSIIKNVRNFSRKPKDQDRSLINILSPLEDSLNLLKKQLEYSNISLKISVDDNLPQIWGDKNKIESVIQNLVINAKDSFSNINDDREKKIDIKIIHQNPNTLLLIISDNAEGMPSEVKNKIFNTFFTTKDPGKGTGLGMSITHDIITDHNGTINVESEVGIGTKFMLEFPINPRKNRRSKKSNLNSIFKLKVSNKNDKIKLLGIPKILIIDDDENIGTIFKDNFEKIFTFTCISNKDEAIKSIKQEIFDLVITDFYMPKISGKEILKLVQKESPNTPVIIMSGLSEQDDNIQQLLKLGACDIISKPFFDNDKIKNSIIEVILNSKKMAA